MDLCEDINLSTSSLGRVILKINNMIKKPSIECELSEALDQFLEKLNESEKYLENGIFNTNFAESALFLQSSTELYSKKVDLLWDCILDYQKRIVLYDKKENTNELDKLEERINRYKKKKKKIFRHSDSINPIDHMYAEFEKEHINFVVEPNIELLKKWKKHDEKSKSSKIGEADMFKVLNEPYYNDNFIIYDLEDDEPNIKYNKWEGYKLYKLLFKLYDAKYIKDPNSIISKLRTEIIYLNQFRHENRIPFNMARDEYQAEFTTYAQKCISELNATLGLDIEEIRKKLCPAETVINLQRLPLPLVTEKLRRLSMMQRLFDSDLDDPCVDKENPEKVQSISGNVEKESCTNQPPNLIQINLNEPTPNERCISTPPTLDSQVTIESQGNELCVSTSPVLDSQVPDESEIIDHTNGKESEECTIENVGKKDFRNHDSGICDENEIENFFENMDELDSWISCDTINNDKPTTPVVSTVNSHSTNNVIYVKNTTIKEKKRKEVDSTSVLESPIKRKKLTLRQIEKLKTPIAVTKMIKWEQFYSMNYFPQHGEGVVNPIHYDSSDDEFEEDHTYDFLPSDSEEEFLGFPNLQLNTNSSKDNDCDREISNILNTSRLTDDSGIWISQFENSIRTPQPSTSRAHLEEPRSVSVVQEVSAVEDDDDYDDDDDEYYKQQREIEKSKENVKQWRARIVPLLRKLDGVDFDIHEYGANIIEPMQINEVKYFKDVVKNKPSAEVVRYFISSLQLANTYNIEIGGVLKGKHSNDTFTIKLLSNDRYHEKLNDYQAPSEEDFRSRLEIIQKMNRRQLQSTPKRPPATKRSKHSY